MFEIKPIIGITANYVLNDKPGTSVGVGGNNQKWHMLADDYVKAVEDAGGIPIILPVLQGIQNVDLLLKNIDGLVFSGGCDVSPVLCGEDSHKKIGELCYYRDLQEIELARYLMDETDIPILGICRGMQLMNIARGGNLIQHIDEDKYGKHFFGNQNMCMPVHLVTTVKGSRIREIAGEEIKVNSYHHQSVNELGGGFSVVAQDSNGIIEAIEFDKRNAFTLAVQWHPEGIYTTVSEHRSIFRTLVDEARKKGGKQ
ncbi:gamma-glutamyl-gamma-aminobutyrate hydrolase family protein [Dethiosulfatibacter aminovorans]|uniref:gamma-glutamyl-gamma-aminobutyrate hydrolase family protein n=1 Tax=Dethiosulfatibacter aminovorans TaxID=332095 RepID=UPI001587D85F|nr:gamma-glutamyl-gamma-aminobutyrate hydrolase family protein [Dethiosulfatibacter aminovorans]